MTDDAANSSAFLSFSGDADEAVDLFAEAQKAVDEADSSAQQQEEEEEDDEAEPEDDFNAAWEVLDLARAIYEKQDQSDEVKLKLAEVFVTLGDVSLETGEPCDFFRFVRERELNVSTTEKFDQAITDYTAGLALKTELLPLSSRQIAEAHYKLSIVLDLTSGRLGDSISHAERALDSVEARLAELRAALSGQGLVQPEPSEPKGGAKGKGKGKATGLALLGDDAIVHMTKGQMEAEEKELQGLREDLALKVSAARIRVLLAASRGCLPIASAQRAPLCHAGGGAQDVAERAGRICASISSQGAGPGAQCADCGRRCEAVRSARLNWTCQEEKEESGNERRPARRCIEWHGKTEGGRRSGRHSVRKEGEARRDRLMTLIRYWSATPLDGLHTTPAHQFHPAAACIPISHCYNFQYTAFAFLCLQPPISTGTPSALVATSALRTAPPTPGSAYACTPSSPPQPQTRPPHGPPRPCSSACTCTSPGLRAPPDPARGCARC